MAKEFNTGVCPELYAATPPGECLRLMLSRMASGRSTDTGLMYADVSRAYFYAKAVRPVYVKLPDEDREAGDEGRCGRLKMSMYGTRDAALNWALEYGDTLKAAGYEQGRANPCLFHHAELQVSIMVHGDDFVAVGPKDNLVNTRKVLEEKYKLKVETLGTDKGQSPEMRILNKVVRWTSAGLELEADPRHAELVIKDLKLAGCKSSAVPGSKEEAKKVKEELPEAKMSEGTKARIELRETYAISESGRSVSPTDEGTVPETHRGPRAVDVVAHATGSLKGREWSNDECGIDVNADEAEEEILDKEQARLYRAVAARLNYIAPDRPDLAYAVKESARSMSSPKASDMQKLRKLGRYLIGCPRLVQRFPWQEPTTLISAFTDSDWAGCSRTARSTSGGVMCIGEHVIKTYCRQQKVVALSSAEAELYATVAASAEAIALVAYCRDLGISMEAELFCDSSAALGIAHRAGIGKVRHLRTQGLWVQEVRVSGRIKYKKVLGSKNPADLLTKHMGAELNKQHLATLNSSLELGRAGTAPTLDSIVIGEYDDTDDNTDHNNGRRVRFNDKVQIRKLSLIHI